MAWVRIDDGYPAHPKLLEAGPVALATDVAGICFSSKHSLDGYIPDFALPTLLNWKQARTDSTTAVVALLSAGRWHRGDKPCKECAEARAERGLAVTRANGYIIHDFFKYNPSAAEWAAMSAAKAKAGRAGAARRWGKVVGIR